MSETALISLNRDKYEMSFTGQAAAIKEDALTTAALIGQVTSDNENAIANEALQKLSELRRTVEKARVEAKAPILKFGKLIDSQAESFVSEVAKEEQRVSRLIGDFFQLQEAKRRAAAEAARLEAERIERQRREEELRILREQAEREAAAKREADALMATQLAEQAEAQRKISEAANAKERARLEKEAAARKEQQERDAIELKRQQELAAANTHAALDAANERASNAQAAVFAAPVTAPVKAAGQTVKAEMEITVTDIWLLARAHPGCVKIEPRISEIKALLTAGVKVAGVTTKEVFKAGALSSKQQAAIEV